MRSQMQSAGPEDSHQHLVENWLVKMLTTGPGSNGYDCTEKKRTKTHTEMQLLYSDKKQKKQEANVTQVCVF